jgi:apolipoprotein N-acyltransferase
VIGHRSRSTWTRVALVVLSALLYGAAFPPLALRECAWLALVPLLVALRGVSVGRAAVLGGVWGVLAAEAVGTWFASGVATYYGRPLFVGAAFFASVAVLLAAPYFAAFAAAYAYGVRRRTIVPETIWVPMAWVACELARARLLVGNPWALLGDSQAGRALVIQIADVTGVYGISFVLAAASAALAAALARRGAVRAVCTALAPALLVASATLVYGWRALAAPAGGPTLSIAVVQANVDVATQWHPGQYGANLEAYLRLSQEALAGDHARVVVWPEAAVTFFLDREPAYRAAIARLFGANDAYLVTGGPAYASGGDAGPEAVAMAGDGDGTRGAGGAQAESVGAPAASHPRATDVPGTAHTGPAELESAATRYFNSAFLLAPDGTVVGRYDKVHLLPFAEYFPLARVEALRRRFARVRTFTAGHALGPFAHAPFGIAPVICFEAMYPELVATAVAAGGELIVNLTNDAWMGRTSFARQHLEIASLRAVENRRYLVRAASTGISAVVDPRGRIVAELGVFERGTFTVPVRPSAARTLYTRYGDAFAAACALGAILILATSRPRPG